MVEELEALYRERLSEFTRAATAIAGDGESGRDAVQDAFAKALRKRRRFRGEGSLEARVWPIVVNAARDADLDYTTIAHALEISSGTVGATLSAARQTLREALTKEVSR